MGQIANWGDAIKFEVTSKKVLTFGNLERTVGGRWKRHELVNRKARLEFAGAELDAVTMTVKFSAEHGVKPRATMKKLEKAAKTGKVDYFYINGKKLGASKLCLESMSEAWDLIWNKGELVSATANLTFTEYVDDTKSSAKSSAPKANTTNPSVKKADANAKKDTKKDASNGKNTNKDAKKNTGNGSSGGNGGGGSSFKVGDVVTFNGGKQYVSSHSGAKGSTAKAGKAKITAGPNCAGNGKAHPYHLVHTSGSKSNVYGWVDEGSFS